MTTYSRLREVHISNFMSIKSGTIAFDDSNIIKITGFNDSGKSAALMAMQCALNYGFASSQKKFIKDGTQFFQVDLLFDDDVTIRYEKHMSGGSLYALYAGEELQYTNRLNNKTLEKITGVPAPIAEYLGMVSFPGGLSLNYGGKADKLLLVETPGADNYAALSSVLQTEDLARAGKLLNKDNNALEAKVQDTHADLNALHRMVNQLSPLTSSLVAQAQAWQGTVNQLEKKADSLSKLVEELKSLVRLNPMPKVQRIDTAKLDGLSGTLDLIHAHKETTPLPEVQVVGTGKLEALSTLGQLVKNYESIDVVPELTPLNVDTLSALDSQISVFKDWLASHKRAAICEAELATVLESRTEAIDELKAEGYVVTECSNCHELSIVDSDGNVVLKDEC